MTDIITRRVPTNYSAIKSPPDEKIIIGPWSELSAWQIVKVYPEFMTRQIQYFSFLRAEPKLVPGEGGGGAETGLEHKT